MSVNRIDPTPVRISTNLSVERQTPKTDFGDRMKAGLDATAGAVASGAAIAAPFVPGGAIVSAAVSSMTTFANQGSGSPQVAGQYQSAMSGVTTLGGGSGGVNTTVGTTAPGGPNIGTTVGSPNYMPGGGGASGGTVGQMNTSLSQAQDDNAKLINLQIAMQRENQVFTTVSNVLKTRHDTVKNSISNVR
jgi:hypothetical protein